VLEQPSDGEIEQHAPPLAHRPCPSLEPPRQGRVTGAVGEVAVAVDTADLGCVVPTRLPLPVALEDGGIGDVELGRQVIDDDLWHLCRVGEERAGNRTVPSCTANPRRARSRVRRLTSARSRSSRWKKAASCSGAGSSQNRPSRWRRCSLRNSTGTASLSWSKDHGCGEASPGTILRWCLRRPDLQGLWSNPVFCSTATRRPSRPVGRRSGRRRRRTGWPEGSAPSFRSRHRRGIHGRKRPPQVGWP
jgi:hypothetical protein